ncbi:hypothetical protein A2V54_03850 [candidate division WWE3 bacterium RBG_19FT_COMBO_53_11]|uniref:Probable inosine/xanthosine triphosphatase n=1 Tax=candidate division WWE3 bacterium RBG_19FT_COMBO_53_11 TaxID=1802613 RepID=A0A1F4UIS2_UNCKA|nr:MAG: hypothetical protein A2155_00200 [candidate division WWE3 bacterium RBG_16_52_45]OGC44864.1 MAG: hypothetical protein A2V54_03850 [candidate division WWE3 bacterium RBG_19FT_COMBO_53_11]
MKVIVGSKNEVKLAAVREILADYPEVFPGVKVSGVEVSSGVPEQPKTINDIVNGAKNRARNAFGDCDYSIGLEGGFMASPHAKTGYFELQACAIFDGRNYHLGLSSAFECPPHVMKLVLEDGLDLNQAMHKAGMTSNPKVGSAEGAIGVLTKGRLNRKEFSEEAIRMALIHLENPNLYQS